jgi:hypothetical protein
MMFDAPGSEKNADLWQAFYLFLAVPPVFALAIPLSLLCFKQPTTRNVLLLIAPFATWVFGASLIALA